MYSSFIKTILNDAAQVARRNFGNIDSTTKTGDNNQVLTATDIEIGKLLTSKAKSEYPDHNIIDEELGVVDNGSEFTWVFDPIDGTSNFANGVPMYGVMVGLLKGAIPIAGGVILPEQDELYIAELGGGAFCNGVRIRTATETELLYSLIAFGVDAQQQDPNSTRSEMAMYAEIALNSRNLRTSNCSAFDVMMVAAGHYGGALYMGREINSSKIWDNVAPHIIVTEAGGVYTDFYGNALEYSDPLKNLDGYSRCAASKELHGQLQEIIAGDMQ